MPFDRENFIKARNHLRRCTNGEYSCFLILILLVILPHNLNFKKIDPHAYLVLPWIGGIFFSFLFLVIYWIEIIIRIGSVLKRMDRDPILWQLCILFFGFPVPFLPEIILKDAKKYLDSPDRNIQGRNVLMEPEKLKNSGIRLFKISWIDCATYFGGPLAGCYMMSKNYQNMGKKDLARKTLIIGIISTIFLSICWNLIPDNILNLIPKSLLPSTYTTIIALYAWRLQGKEIVEHVKSGGQVYSGGKFIGIGILSMLVFVVIFVICGYTIESIRSMVLSKDNKNFYVWLNIPIVHKDKKGIIYYCDMKTVVKTKSVDKCLQFAEEKSYKNYPAGCDGGSALNKAKGITFDKFYESKFNLQPEQLPYIYSKYSTSQDEGVVFAEDNSRTFQLFLDEFAEQLKSDGAKDLKIIYPITK